MFNARLCRSRRLSSPPPPRTRGAEEPLVGRAARLLGAAHAPLVTAAYHRPRRLAVAYFFLLLPRSKLHGELPQ